MQGRSRGKVRKRSERGEKERKRDGESG